MRYQLISSFLSPKILNINQSICFRNHDQFYIFKIQTFGNHLRSDENIGFSILQFFVEFFVRKLLAHRVYIHSVNFGFGEYFLSFLFDLLHANTFCVQISTVTTWARCRFSGSVTTIMAFQFIRSFVIGHHDVAIATICHVSTSLAFDDIGVSTAVVENDALLFLL
ncbi:hypothetical protein D3C86_1264110 [compost metagenome]